MAAPYARRTFRPAQLLGHVAHAAGGSPVERLLRRLGTLRPQFAAELAARHDPLGILGLARVMGPAFRARFQEAFDQALAKAKIQTTTEGDQE